jgi:hypothetical protein
MSTIPNKTFSLTIQGNNYSTKITQGKMIDFELNKITLSKGFYDSIRDIQTLNLIDAISALYAFFPEIKKDSKLDTIMDLEPTETKELMTAIEPFFAWYIEWKKFMSEPSKVEEKEDVKDSE